jgi:dipeptidase E
MSANTSATGPLFLASADCPGLADWLVRHRGPGPIVLFTAASAGLPDRAAIVDPFVRAAMASGAAAMAVDSAAALAGALPGAGALLMPGGDPFRLATMLKDAGAGELLRLRCRAGLPLAGQSAGAMVCGPTLEPVVLTSPFTPRSGQPLDGLGLTPRLVLPHHDRPGRAARHREAAIQWGARIPLLPLWDGEVLIEDAEGWRIRCGPVDVRPAQHADAAAIEAVFRTATANAWAGFVGADRLAAAPVDTDRWHARIAAEPNGFLVAEDEQGVVGFVYFRAAPVDDLDAAPVGEVDLLYALPRAWGRGIGRRLLDRATFALLARGYREAVLWTEARNVRALTVYRENGWIQDGHVRDRDYLGAPIRNVRHRFDLRARAGGGDRPGLMSAAAMARKDLDTGR